jgi:hypothetical protein
MTIAEALKATSQYPIPANTIEKICVDRGLTSTDNYTQAVGESDSYRLAQADVYFFLGTSFNIVEQEVGINAAIAIKKKLCDEADSIYDELGDPKFSGNTYGYIGEDYNG